MYDFRHVTHLLVYKLSWWNSVLICVQNLINLIFRIHKPLLLWTVHYIILLITAQTFGRSYFDHCSPKSITEIWLFLNGTFIFTLEGVGCCQGINLYWNCNLSNTPSKFTKQQVSTNRDHSNISQDFPISRVSSLRHLLTKHKLQCMYVKYN